MKRKDSILQNYYYSKLPKYQSRGQVGKKLPIDYNKFLEYNKTAPENRQAHEDWQYGNPDDYDHYGMWDALGKPKNFQQALEMNPDWQPDPYDGSYHGASVNPNTSVFLKSYYPGQQRKPGSTTWMEVADFYKSSDPNWNANKLSIIYDPELKRLRYVPKKTNGGDISIADLRKPNWLRKYDKGGSLDKYQVIGEVRKKLPITHYVFAESSPHSLGKPFDKEAKDLESYITKNYPDEKVVILPGYGKDYFENQVKSTLGKVGAQDRVYIFGHHGDMYAGVSNDLWGDALEAAQKRAGNFNCYLGSCSSEDLFTDELADDYRGGYKYKMAPSFSRINNFYYRPKTSWYGVNPNAQKYPNSGEGVLHAMYSTNTDPDQLKYIGEFYDYHDKLEEQLKASDKQFQNIKKQFDDLYSQVNKYEEEDKIVPEDLGNRLVSISMTLNDSYKKINQQIQNDPQYIRLENRVKVSKTPKINSSLKEGVDYVQSNWQPFNPYINIDLREQYKTSPKNFNYQSGRFNNHPLYRLMYPFSTPIDDSEYAKGGQLPKAQVGLTGLLDARELARQNVSPSTNAALLAKMKADAQAAELKRKMESAKRETFVGPARQSTVYDEQMRQIRNRTYAAQNAPYTRINAQGDLSRATPNISMTGTPDPRTPEARWQKGSKHMMNAMEVAGAIEGLPALYRGLTRGLFKRAPKSSGSTTTLNPPTSTSANNSGFVSAPGQINILGRDVTFGRPSDAVINTSSFNPDLADQLISLAQYGKLPLENSSILKSKNLIGNFPGVRADYMDMIGADMPMYYKDWTGAIHNVSSINPKSLIPYRGKEAFGSVKANNLMGDFKQMFTNPKQYFTKPGKPVITEGPQVFEFTPTAPQNFTDPRFRNIKTMMDLGPEEYQVWRTHTNQRLKNLAQRGQLYDRTGLSQSEWLSPETVHYHGTHAGRPIVEVKMPNGSSEYFYKSSGWAGKEGAGAKGTTEGMWQVYDQHGLNFDPDRNYQAIPGWFGKNAGYKDWYGSNTFRNFAGQMDRTLAQKFGVSPDELDNAIQFFPERRGSVVNTFTPQYSSNYSVEGIVPSSKGSWITQQIVTPGNRVMDWNKVGRTAAGIGIGSGLVSGALNRKEHGGEPIQDQMGQWKYPGVPTRIMGNEIDMSGLIQPLVAKTNQGIPKLLLPNMQYKFNPMTQFVDEHPIPHIPQTTGRTPMVRRDFGGEELPKRINLSLPKMDQKRGKVRINPYIYYVRSNPNVNVLGAGFQGNTRLNNRWDLQAGLNVGRLSVPRENISRFLGPSYNLGLGYRFKNGGYYRY